MAKYINLEANLGVVSLLANANSHSDYSGERYYFEGALCQMSTAQNVARQLGIHTDVEGGLPFVTSEEDFDTVTQYLIDHQIEGWHHYVTRAEYRQINGEYPFAYTYWPFKTIILEIANKFDIYVGTNIGVTGPFLYVTSKENYSIIMEELNKILL